MRDFLKMMRQYVSPYKGYMGGAVVLNILSVVFNIFSFAVLVPLLNILFKVDTTQYQFIPWGSEAYSFKDTLMNNFYFYVSQHIAQHATQGAVARLIACSVTQSQVTQHRAAAAHQQRSCQQSHVNLFHKRFSILSD